MEKGETKSGAVPNIFREKKLLRELALKGVVKLTLDGKPFCEIISSGGVFDFAIKWSASDEIWFSTEYARKVWNLKPSPLRFSEMIDITNATEIITRRRGEK